MKEIISYTLYLADTNLILSQRNGEWCGHGPILEQDIAMTNITLDLLGQARNFYQYAATLSGDGATEDSLAYLRTEREFKNCLLAEQPNGDWGQTILRQFFISQYQFLLYNSLINCKDEQLSAIAEKGLKEVTYHLRWSSEWVIRLGDGTEESHRRMRNAMEALWTYTGELFIPAPYEQLLIDNGIIPSQDELKQKYQENIISILIKANLNPPSSSYMQKGGKTGIHTEHLGPLLAELQYMQRTYPGAEW